MIDFWTFISKDRFHALTSLKNLKFATPSFTTYLIISQQFIKILFSKIPFSKIPFSKIPSPGQFISISMILFNSVWTVFQWELHSPVYLLLRVLVAIGQLVRGRSHRFQGKQPKTREDIFQFLLPQPGIELGTLPIAISPITAHHVLL